MLRGMEVCSSCLCADCDLHSPRQSWLKLCRSAALQSSPPRTPASLKHPAAIFPSPPLLALAVGRIRLGLEGACFVEKQQKTSTSTAVRSQTLAPKCHITTTTNTNTITTHKTTYNTNCHSTALTTRTTRSPLHTVARSTPNRLTRDGL